MKDWVVMRKLAVTANFAARFIGVPEVFEVRDHALTLDFAMKEHGMTEDIVAYHYALTAYIASLRHGLSSAALEMMASRMTAWETRNRLSAVDALISGDLFKG